MTRIEFIRPGEQGEEYRVKMQGHAAFAHGGADIVCAAVSALCCTLAEAITRKQRTGEARMTLCRMNDGDVEIAAYPVGESVSLVEIFETILVGFEMLCEEYPKHVFLTQTSFSEKVGGKAKNETI